MDKIKFIKSVELDDCLETLSKVQFDASNTANLKTKGISVNRYTYDAATTDSLSVVTLSGTTADKIIFVSIGYQRKEDTSIDENVPKRFQLTFNGGVMGTMSSFEILAVDGDLNGDIVVDTLETPATDEKNELFIIIGTVA